MKREFSGKLLLRMEPKLHKRVAGQASKERLSINTFCVKLISEGLLAQRKSPWWLAEGKKIVPQLRRKFGKQLVGVAIFGSQVDGTATQSSDIDLLIVMDSGASIKRSLYSWWDEGVKWEGSIEISPQFVNLPNKPRDVGGIWFEIAMSSEILWERGQKLTSFIKSLKKLIENDQVRRYWSSGQPYWVWRKDEEQRSSA